MNIKKVKHLSYAYSGKDIFMFVLDRREQSPKIRPFENYNYGGYYGKPGFVYSVDRDTLLGKNGNTWGGCFKNSSQSGYYLAGDSCAAVIMKDGWEIKSDYPWRK